MAFVQDAYLGRLELGEDGVAETSLQLGDHTIRVDVWFDDPDETAGLSALTCRVASIAFYSRGELADVSLES